MTIKISQFKDKTERITVARKGTHFQGLRVGSILILRNALSEETHVRTKQQSLLGRDTQAESCRLGKHRRTALPCGSQS